MARSGLWGDGNMLFEHADRIGDRLDHPDRVPPDQQHLIADDQQRVKRILEWPVSGRVLDAGCSDGAITTRIAARWQNIHLHSCDVWWAVSPSPPGYFQWNVTTPLPRLVLESYQAVYCCELFEHLSHHEATLALRHLCAVLKRGGDLLVTVPNRWPDSQYVTAHRDRWHWPDHWQCWDYDSLSDFLAPHFTRLEWTNVYDEDTSVGSGIWLMVRACGRL